MKKIYLLLTLVILMSCTHEKIIKNSSSFGFETSSGENVEIKLPDSDVKSKKVDSVIVSSLGKYADYIAPTDYITGISSCNTNPLEENFTYAYSGINNNGNIQTKSSLNELVDVSIDGINIISTKAGEAGRANLKSIFGKQVKFSFGGTGTKSGNNVEEVELYVPEIIKITAPAITSEEEYYPLCDYKNFLVRWNEDLDNENGVLVIVEWTGLMVVGEDYDDVYIRRTDLVADTGEALVKPELFNGIPDTAMCSLTLIRGNIEHVIVDEHSYKLLGDSEQRFSFVLIRELEHI